jgi:serine/threonine protein kinase
MDAQQAAHPTHDRLKAFGLGEPIDPAAAETIEEHLETCAECRRVVAELSADPFLGRLRAARTPDGTSAPERPLDGIARSITGPPTPAARPAAGSDTLPPELADHANYEVLRELGRGGMGVVYLARNRLMDRPEVLKVMNRELVNKPGAADRFLRELRSAARLAHPNVVRAYSADRLGDTLMFAMEYVEGDDLANLVKARGRLPVLNACYYAQQVAAGLQHAHEMGMVHRDVKPANLILARSGKKHVVKILDFGLAKVRGEDADGVELTGAGAMMGTPSYMAPEQWQDAARADVRADVYSLGCTLYFLLAGNPPFVGNWQGLLWKHQKEEPESLTKVRPEVPADLAAVVAKMMAKDPAARYQTPAEVAKALAPFVRPGAAKPVAPASEDTPPLAAAASTTAPAGQPAWETLGDVSQLSAAPTPARPLPRRRWLWPAVACGVALAALLVAWAGGAFKVKTRDGTIVLENLPPDAEVLVDGETVTVTRNGEQATVSLTRGGPHKLKVVQGGKEVYSSDLTVTVGGEPVRVRVEPAAVAKIPPADATKSGAGGQEPDADGFVPLFNGKDLTGWEVYGGGTGNWKVVDGAIVSSGPVSHLFSQRGDYKNFHFRVEAMINDRGNSGQQFRTLFRPGWPPGYEAQINATHADPIKTGSLYLPSIPEVLVKEQLHNPGEWFTQEAIADGNHIIIKVNGKTTVDWRDPANTYTSGHFALQQHDPGTVVKFRKVEVKELPPTKPPPKPTAVELEKAGIAELQRVLLAHEWYYLDNLYPPGAAEQFFPDGTFSHWRWKYWVVGPRTMRVHYDRKQTNKDTGILFTFNEELTKFTAEFTDPNGRVHKITGTRQ